LQHYVNYKLKATLYTAFYLKYLIHCRAQVKNRFYPEPPKMLGSIPAWPLLIIRVSRPLQNIIWSPYHNVSCLVLHNTGMHIICYGILWLKIRVCWCCVIENDKVHDAGFPLYNALLVLSWCSIPYWGVGESQFMVQQFISQ